MTCPQPAYMVADGKRLSEHRTIGNPCLVYLPFGVSASQQPKLCAMAPKLEPLPGALA